ncbi:inositol monophosphatase [Rathayibacter festucae]|uniref:inositol monophosphatase family protein n=1 Tax=Rathayibacter festucae TaxID=110937 RepID=UPI001FB4259A|nr:inositol monophosphatase family protein [Rathayibacter festucae]MCJ1702105.1 inositol monophosphatase [Rathayibacter festucae]
MTTTNALDLLALARDVAAEAGALAATMRADGISVASTKSSQLDIVTQADTAVESLIRTRLHEARPDDGFFGEETGQDSGGSSGVVWIVDPIDGTVNYLYGSPYWAVSIAATVDHPDGTRTSVAGCVYAPALNTEYAAAAGHPAHLNGTELLIDDTVPLERALFTTGFTYDLSKREQALSDISSLATQVRDFRLTGAAALDICGVAEGRIDAYFFRGLPIWDYAAAALIAAQAGATVRGLNGGAPSSDLFIVASAPLANAVAPLLAPPTTTH